MSTAMDELQTGTPPMDLLARARALRGAREFAAADVLLSSLVSVENPSEAALMEYASVANDQSEWPVAAQRWQSVVERFPQQALAHAAWVSALTAARRFDEAEVQIVELLRRHPEEVQARWAAAWCAHEREAWELAAARWQAVLDLDAQDVPAVCCHITALSNLGDDAAAAAAVQTALERFNDDPRVAEACAWIPHKREEWSLAVTRWRRLTTLDPDYAPGFACLATALRGLGQHQPAEAALLRAIEIDPDEFTYRSDYALVAQERGDATEARRRWAALRERYAGDPVVLGEIGHHELRGGLSLMEAQSAAPAALPDTGERALLLSMESLGDNCEFGMLQRRFGAEPLGLLRFAGISLSNLIDALKSGFVEIGEPGRMRIEVLDSGEYFIHDAHGIEQHTFVYRHELREDRFTVQTARRSVFLRNKLLEDLRHGTKLFVYRTKAISRAEALELHEALCIYGRPQLLCVQLSDADHAPATVQTVQAGLLFGYVSRFATQAGLQDCQYEEWLSVCKAAEQLRDEWRAAAPKA